MNKTQKIKNATRNNKKHNFVAKLKKIASYPWRACKAVWRWFVRICSAIWNWLKEINIVGMINLTLLVAIIVLFSCLILDVLRCDNSKNVSSKNISNVVVTNDTYKSVTKNNANRPVVNSEFKGALPVKANNTTGITPKIQVLGVKKPVVVAAVSKPAQELPKQNLYGDVIVDMYPNSPVLMNGVIVEGNLFVQNMRKYTLPCGMKVSGHLFIRNVEKLSFCGGFTVRGNIYVNRQSSFGPIPHDAHIGGQVIL